jgi:putative flippase GtrA
MKILKFLLSGGVLAVLAFGLNAFFVEVVGLGKPLAYAFVMGFQMAAGFLLARFLVFEDRGARHGPTLLKYLGAVLGFRFVEWLLYVAQVRVWEIPYLLAQFNCWVMVALKFLVYRAIFEHPGRRES